MTGSRSSDVLAADVAERLVEFARACKAAARVVSLYPAAHPAIQMALTRLLEVSARATSDGPLRIKVIPDELLIDGRGLARPDPAIAELAELLHDHLVGELAVQAGGDPESWRSFVLLLARSPQEIQNEGGIARLWTTSGAQHIEIREIDYAAVLRERPVGESASWDRIVASYLQGEARDLDDKTLQALLEAAADPQRLAQLACELEERAAAEGGVPAQAASLVRMMESLVQTVARTAPGRLDTVLDNLTAITPTLSPELLLELLARRAEPAGPAATEGGVDVIGELVSRLNDSLVAQFIARSVADERSATARLAQALQALVPDPEHMRRLLPLAREEAARSPFGQQPEFDQVWKRTEELLTSYSDEAYVSGAYGRELSTARRQAIDVERISDDPPERVRAWLNTVSDASLRGLDLQLLLDLLAIETDAARWRDLAAIVVAHLDDVVLVGDFAAAHRLAERLVHEVGAGGRPERRDAAAAALSRLVSGSMMSQLVSHLQTVDDHAFEQIKKFCATLGQMMVNPLAEALSTEERARARQRLRDLLVAFGTLGRGSVEQLKQSPNPAARRTAVYLLREFGGAEALAQLESLLDDHDPHVQREAIRAILLTEGDEAYGALERALTGGSPRAREAVLQTLGTVRDERAAPLFCHIVLHTDPRGRLGELYLRAVDALGTMGGTRAVEALREALYRGEWWLPFRTARLRAAAAASLARINSTQATQVLTEAAGAGPRGVRLAARAALASRSGRRPAAAGQS